MSLHDEEESTDVFDDWFIAEHDSNGIRLEADVDETVEDSYTDVELL